jgi:hypothetical protein
MAARPYKKRYTAGTHIPVVSIAEFDPPQKMLLTEARFLARTGQPPFVSKMTTEFTGTTSPGGSVLRVVQDGFPTDPIAHDFYLACETGWKNTFAGILKYLPKILKLS